MDGTMKAGWRYKDGAKARVHYPMVVSANLRGMIREVSGVSVPEDQQGKGLGSALMADICADADRSGVILMLIADTAKLAEFYGRFGFDAIQTDPAILMCRTNRNG